MFCPKCSRPLAEGVQFCQQCGQALGGVRGLVEGGAEARGMSARRKGYRRGFVLMLLALLALPLFPLVEGLLESLIPSVENTRLDELPLELFGAALLLLLVGGLARVLYARLFESAEAAREGSADAYDGAAAAELPGSRGERALPPSRSIPAEEFFAGRVNTADLAEPRSVTEHTTRSLRAD